MATIREEAKAYTPQQTKNIAELDSVSVELQLEDREGTTKEGEAFKYKVAVIDGQDYRVPYKVIGDLKAILEKRPDITHFQVIKSGTGMATQYTVLPAVPNQGGSPPSPSGVVMPRTMVEKAYNNYLHQKSKLEYKRNLGMLDYQEFNGMLEAIKEEYNKALINNS